MYMNLSSGKSVQIVGPFHDFHQFLEWAEEEKVTPSFRIMGIADFKDTVFHLDELKRQLKSESKKQLI